MYHVSSIHKMVLTLRFLQVLCIVIGQIDIKFSNAPSCNWTLYSLVPLYIPLPFAWYSNLSLLYIFIIGQLIGNERLINVAFIHWKSFRFKNSLFGVIMVGENALNCRLKNRTYKKTCPANRACFGALAAKITIEIQAILSCKSETFTDKKQSVLDQKRPGQLK